MFLLKDIDFAFKASFIAIGDVFEENKEMSKVRNFFNDFFHSNEEKVTVSMKSLFKIVVVLVGLAEDKFQLVLFQENQKSKGNALL